MFLVPLLLPSLHSYNLERQRQEVKLAAQDTARTAAAQSVRDGEQERKRAYDLERERAEEKYANVCEWMSVRSVAH